MKRAILFLFTFFVFVSGGLAQTANPAVIYPQTPVNDRVRALVGVSGGGLYGNLAVNLLAGSLSFCCASI